MNCHQAKLSDIPRLLQLAEIEHGRSQFKEQKFDAAFSQYNLEQAVSGALSRVFISDAQGGFIAGVMQPCLYNKFFRAYELCWYAEDGSGLALLDAFCDWAKKMRAVDVVVSNYAGLIPSEKFTRVIKRKGFKHLGSTYSKQLEI